MPKFLQLLIVLILPLCGYAQQDSLFVQQRDDRWVIPHKAARGETLFQLARKYHVPAATLADLNGLTYQSGLELNQTVYIPIGGYNQVSNQPTTNDVRKLYYRVQQQDNLFRISKYAGTQQKTMQQWNNLPDNKISSGQTLFVGWVLYDATQLPVYNEQLKNEPINKSKITTTTAPPPPVIEQIEQDDDDSVVVKQDTIPPLQKLYNTQTSNGQNTVEEKGTGAFFEMDGALKSSKTIYAFHNTAAKGSIIKIVIPGTGRTAYAKVLGPIPDMKQYHNSLIGISEQAKAALGVSDDKIWCELSFAGY